MTGACVLITGGARGIGFAIARNVVSRGDRVILFDADAAALDAALHTLGTSARGSAIDVSDAAAIKAATAEHAGDWTPTHLVNNAGILGRKMAFDQMDADEVDRVLSVNLRGLLLATSAFLATRRAHPSAAIVNMSSIAGFNGGAPGLSVYGATKGAILALTRAMARDLAPDIRVNALAPGIIETDMQKGVFASGAAMREVVAAIPQKRLGTPGDVAEAAIWLLFGAPYSTGETIRISGGRT
ncbi:SDR family oxidoreductase [Rhizobium sp. TRM95111]|uniref:SDR family NAD(P)-dependent oxidoreductase n=1 Tax=Rhizobium alarense TaxID=2846851 RepID=UPI001F2356C8|nr:SDR family oxidoreductase [Rhizobium alarense]MCF3642064.1 SDR family oxidoreductase [Rhizobium alarense]